MKLHLDVHDIPTGTVPWSELDGDPFTRLVDIAMRETLAWQARAACLGLTDLFYPDPELGETSEEAKQICAGCPVRAECLDYAFRHSERWGIWAGLSEHERRAVKRQRYSEVVAA